MTTDAIETSNFHGTVSSPTEKNGFCVMDSSTNAYIDTVVIFTIAVFVLFACYLLYAQNRSKASSSECTPHGSMGLRKMSHLTRCVAPKFLPSESPRDEDPQSTSLAAFLPHSSPYYSLPFFTDTLYSKQDFVGSLIELGNDPLLGWVLIKKSSSKGRKWKKRFVSLDSNARLRVFSTADAARKNINLKMSLKIFAVKPADPIEIGTNTLELCGTLGGTYYMRVEDAMTAKKWLCVATKRAIEASTFKNPGVDRVYPVLSSSVSLPHDIAHSKETPDQRPALQSHTLNLSIKELTYLNDSALRQFYFVIKFHSEGHTRNDVPVGQTPPKNCMNGNVYWDDQWSWQFRDHFCSECEECRKAIGIAASSSVISALPEILILTLYETRLRCLTTKIGQVSISISELFGIFGMKRGELECCWPLVAFTENATLGQVLLKLEYTACSVRDQNHPQGETDGAEAQVASAKPFLVTNESQLESVGEYPLPPSITDCQHLFDLFYRNESDPAVHKRWEGYRDARGETETEVGDWEMSREYGGFTRVSTFRSLTNATIGPSSTLCTLTELLVPTAPNNAFASIASSDDTGSIESSIRACIDPAELVIRSKMVLHDIPYGDCFAVEKVCCFVRSIGSGCVFKVLLGIPFSKGCLFKSKIISSTRESVQAASELMVEEWEKAIRSDEHPANGTEDGRVKEPKAPFLTSNENERHFIGEFSLPSEMDSIYKLFACFYANGTEHRMEELRQSVGDTELEVDLWQISEECGGIVRELRFRSLTHAPIGPSSTRTKNQQHIQIPSSSPLSPEALEIDVRQALGRMKTMVLEIKTELQDIPYHDCFTAEQHVEFKLDQHGFVVARVHAAVPFTKSTLFKSKIVSSFRESVAKSNQGLFEYIAKYVVDNKDSLSVESKDKYAIPESSENPSTQRKAKFGLRSSSETDSLMPDGPNSWNESQPSSHETSNSIGKWSRKPGKKKRFQVLSESSISHCIHSAASPHGAGPTLLRKPSISNRLNSTLDGTVALEEIFENQRMSLFGKWGPNHLLPTDRARFSNRSGHVELGFEQIRLPPHWVWTTPWKIDKRYTDCDDEGWSYATDFRRFNAHLARGKSSSKRLGASVRRRRWIRMMAYVPQGDLVDVTENGEGKEEDPPARMVKGPSLAASIGTCARKNLPCPICHGTLVCSCPDAGTKDGTLVTCHRTGRQHRLVSSSKLQSSSVSGSSVSIGSATDRAGGRAGADMNVDQRHERMPA
uniref:Uncharacterized protein AlNc14C40G3448 n=1 Tax=Albugo laibachii Nc14 TaxID=890382 RepID=F0W9I9_9STRA|nr:conserved hypothetical protein [Albugo laibachii Nc14]|eukprot:CCA17803.1 conserved hypothetical protein [Albugo laibachii Nc14]